MPIFIEVVRLLLKTGRKKEGKRREIIERPRAAIDANKAAEPRARKLSEEMRRLISLLDLDSFLRGRESLSLSLPLSSRSPLSLSYLDSPGGGHRREIYRHAAGISNLSAFIRLSVLFGRLAIFRLDVT